MQGRMENDLKREAKIQQMLAELPEYVSEWDASLHASHKTTTTRSTYVIWIREFLKTINEDAHKVTLEDLTYSVVQRYLISKETRKVDGGIKETSDSQRCLVWFALNSFFNYLKKMNEIKDNPMEAIDRPKNHDLDRINHERKLLTEADFHKILEAVDYSASNAHKKWRNKLILLLFMSTGMRRTALTEINIEDIDFNASTLVIIDKRRKMHTYPLSAPVMRYLEKWLFVRKRVLARLGRETNALFINTDGERLTGYGVDYVVKKYSKIALGYEISPHKLRAGFTSILYNKTHDIEFVRRAVGHKNVSTTQRYFVTESTENKEQEEASKIIISSIL